MGEKMSWKYIVFIALACMGFYFVGKISLGNHYDSSIPTDTADEQW